MTSRRDLLVTAVTAGVAISAGLWLRAANRPATPLVPLAPLPHGTRLTPPRPLPAVRLQDETGTTVGDAYFRRGWRLLFFGFTRCPEFCPVTLQTLADVRTQLMDLPAQRLPDVVLVTVDPAADDPAQLARYLAGFGPGFHGLTGDAGELDVLYRALGVSARRMDMGDGGYMYDHGTAVYVVDPAGRWVALLPAPHATANVVAAYRAVVAG